MSEIHQGHGDHWTAIYENAAEIAYLLPEIIQEAKLLGTAQDVEVNNKQLGIYDIAYLNYPLNNKIDCCLLILIDREKNQNSVCSFYPIINNGLNLELKLTHIQEWDNKIEAVLTAEDSDGREYRFFDCLYGLNKHSYIIGKDYIFSLSGLVERAEIVENPSFTVEGEQALNYRLRLGEIVEDKNNVEPVVFDTSRLKAFFQTYERVPQIVEFQSPIKSIIESRVQENLLYQVDISIYDDDNILPIIIRQDKLMQIPEKEQPLRGVLDLFGYLVKA